MQTNENSSSNNKIAKAFTGNFALMEAFLFLINKEF